MKAVGSVVLIAGSLYVAYVSNKSRSTAPWNVPNVAGTWVAAVVHVDDGRRCSGTVRITQPAAKGEIAGSIESDCLSAVFEAELLEGARWGILGKVHYEDRAAPTQEYTARLFGHLEGSPGSRIIASTSAFTSGAGDAAP